MLAAPVDERVLPDEAPDAYVLRVAQSKAQAQPSDNSNASAYGVKAQMSLREVLTPAATPPNMIT